MRKILVILLMLITVSVKSITPGNLFLKTWVAGAFIVPIYEKFWYTPGHNSNGIYFAGSIDPKIALIDNQLNYRAKLYFHHSRFEPCFIYEAYPYNKFESLTMGLDYLVIDKKLSLLLGLETGRNYNYNSKKLHMGQTLGVNAEIRYTIKDRLSVSYVFNPETSPEISKDLRLNGYLNINFKLINL